MSMMTCVWGSDYFVGIALWVIIGVVGLSIGILVIVHQKRIRFVSESSILLANIEKINQSFTFHTFISTFQHRKLLKSKAQFDRADLSDILDEWLFYHEFEIKQSLRLANENCALFDKYLEEYERAIRNDETIHHDYHDKYAYFRRYENKLARQKQQNPTRSISVTVHKQYTSPKGRNYYHAAQTYTQTAIGDSLARQQCAREKQNSRQRERALMTDSMRYEIMKRDGFKCCLCGATAADGAKLHVDHIMPVSKGGKTERSNLRTLCEQCNLGKGAKYDPYGKN